MPLAILRARSSHQASGPSASAPKTSDSASAPASASRPVSAAPSSALPSCRLAVTWQVFNESTREWTPNRAGFIVPPAGTLIEDPAGTAVVRASGQAFYDLADQKWLPVGREAISPDGKQATDGGVEQLAIDRDGKPVLGLTTNDGVRLLKLTARNQPTTLYEGPEYPRPQGSFAVDGNGLWLSTFDGAGPMSSPPFFIGPTGRVTPLPSVYPNSVAVAGGCH